VEVLGVLLPLALGVALSTVPLTATVVILLSPRARQSGPAFLVGWVLGLALVTLGFVIGLAFLPIPGPALARQPFVAVFELLLGLALFVFGVVTFVRSPHREKKPLPEWTKRIDKLGPVPAFGLGLVLNVRPKALALAFAAALAINSVRLNPTEFAVIMIVYVLLGSSTIAVPVVMQLIRPDGTAERLRRARTWLSRNSRVITIIVSLMLGVLLIGDALGRF